MGAEAAYSGAYIGVISKHLYRDYQFSLHKIIVSEENNRKDSARNMLSKELFLIRRVRVEHQWKPFITSFSKTYYFYRKTKYFNLKSQVFDYFKNQVFRSKNQVFPSSARKSHVYAVSVNSVVDEKTMCPATVFIALLVG